MNKWTSYKVSGEIEAVYGGQEPVEEELDGLAFVAGEGDYDTQFIDVSDSPVIADQVQTPFTQNKPSIIADAVDECDISGLPDPCTVTWPDGQIDEVTGGSIQYSVDYPGDYVIKLKTPINLETEVYIEATPVI
ncbi:MAG: hypothetical protein KUG64_10970 [Cycloclasticus sp.]|nr:hypothetical protein [Cycloclasticus sp.]